jgi:hypothetical protein
MNDGSGTLGMLNASPEVGHPIYTGSYVLTLISASIVPTVDNSTSKVQTKKLFFPNAQNGV